MLGLGDRSGGGDAAEPAASPPVRRRLRRAAPALATGFLLALAFPPADAGWLAVVAPAPLLWSWRNARSVRAAAGDGLLAGVAFFAFTVSWARNFGAIAYVPLVLALAAFWAGTGALVGCYAVRRRAGPLVLASAWVMFEALRSRWPFGGLSWGDLGYAFHDIPALRALATWGGVLLVSFVAVLVAALLAQLVDGSRWRAVGGLVLVVLGVVSANVWRPRLPTTGQLRIAVLQGNDRNRPLTQEEIAARFLPVSHFGLASLLRGPADLVVFPESSLDDDPRGDPFLSDRLAEVARARRSAVLANAAVPTGDGRLFNMNFLYGPDGVLEGTYAKRHLVPFGEYVPFRRWLGFVRQLEQVPLDYAPGRTPGVFSIAGIPVSTMICFESTFARIARADARRGAQVLVVSTNNRSFGRSANSAQHLAMGQLRAAETGHPLVQAAISGITAFVDSNGAVQARTRLFERTVLERTVVATRGRTPFVRYGDWVLLVAGLVLVAGAARARRVPVLGAGAGVGERP